MNKIIRQIYSLVNPEQNQEGLLNAATVLFYHPGFLFDCCS